ncbi:hypothetical protein FA13DRAFT_1717758 [Coprinellus micaceus]|uniref:Uncharacterized protein n=1 Tax=Coprinellus micaceus TaxID=71717 RepID=A0A4Y7SF13_COPMI|nr:hypothetical protein FA13DRAFT_1717758 [Coprinellus micaceus]
MNVQGCNTKKYLLVKNAEELTYFASQWSRVDLDVHRRPSAKMSASGPAQISSLLYTSRFDVLERGTSVVELPEETWRKSDNKSKSQGRTLRRAIVDITSDRGQGIYSKFRIHHFARAGHIQMVPQRRKLVHCMSERLRDEMKRLGKFNVHTESNFEQGKLPDNPNV